MDNLSDVLRFLEAKIAAMPLRDKFWGLPEFRLISWPVESGLRHEWD